MGERENWIVMPFVGLWDEYTRTALDDCLGMKGSRILAISNGSDEETDKRLRTMAAHSDHRIIAWFHQPPMLSLSATWNKALEFVWKSGGHQALMVNNDVRLNPATYESLLLKMLQTGALFVSATGVTQEQYLKAYPEGQPPTAKMMLSRGGPDFSCFLISKECHEKYSFDEGFVPCYCEDIDFHRQLMIAGERDRIFSINVPFLHFASGTIKSWDDEKAAAFHRQVSSLSRAYYQKKWGGDASGVNQETTIEPFVDGKRMPCGCVTTPQLQFCAHDAPGDDDYEDPGEIVHETNKF